MDVPLRNIVHIGCLTFILPLDIHFRPLTSIFGGQIWMLDIFKYGCQWAPGFYDDTPSFFREKKWECWWVHYSWKDSRPQNLFRDKGMVFLATLGRRISISQAGCCLCVIPACSIGSFIWRDPNRRVSRCNLNVVPVWCLVLQVQVVTIVCHLAASLHHCS